LRLGRFLPCLFCHWLLVDQTFKLVSLFLSLSDASTAGRGGAAVEWWATFRVLFPPLSLLSLLPVRSLVIRVVEQVLERLSA
jgi:hypothetical protein